jgi:hypothetical protein
VGKNVMLQLIVKEFQLQSFFTAVHQNPEVSTAPQHHNTTQPNEVFINTRNKMELEFNLIRIESNGR